jgi:hypothetical protein
MSEVQKPKRSFLKYLKYRINLGFDTTYRVRMPDVVPDVEAVRDRGNFRGTVLVSGR